MNRRILDLGQDHGPHRSAADPQWTCPREPRRVPLPALGAVQLRRRTRDAIARLVDGLMGESLEVGRREAERGRRRVGRRLAELARAERPQPAIALGHLGRAVGQHDERVPGVALAGQHGTRRVAGLAGETGDGLDRAIGHPLEQRHGTQDLDGGHDGRAPLAGRLVGRERRTRTSIPG